MDANEQPVGLPLCIGVVDDDADVRRAVRRLLLASGFSVRVYASGQAFLESRDTADCLVLDVHLRGMTGVELYARLRATGAPPPAVFITAHHELANEIERLGVTCLLKPFDDQALIDALGRACRSARR